MAAWRRIGVLGIAWLAGACGGHGSGSPAGPGPSGGQTTLPSGPLVFRAAPVSLDALRYIVPLGNINPPSHTLPTDHIYFYFADPAAGETPAGRRTDFFAPADGTVLDVIDNGIGADRKVRIQATATMVYYIDHLMPSVALTRGTSVTAGTRLGTTGGAYGVDLGVVNDGLTLGFVNPARYGSETLHADAPLKYFEDPLKLQLYSKVRSIAQNFDGRIDFDVPGRLAGNWFGESDQVPLTFAYDTVDPSAVLIGTGSGLALSGVFGIAASDPAPRDVSTASGPVAYTIHTAPSGGPLAHLLVEMTADQRIRVEIITPVTAPAVFTAAAKTFVR